MISRPFINHGLIRGVALATREIPVSLSVQWRMPLEAAQLGGPPCTDPPTLIRLGPSMVFSLQQSVGYYRSIPCDHHTKISVPGFLTPFYLAGIAIATSALPSCNRASQAYELCNYTLGLFRHLGDLQGEQVYLSRSLSKEFF